MATKYDVEFVNIHRHAHHSLFDGYGKPKAAAAYAKSMGQTALCLTDHGTVSGLIEHYTACNEVGIKPLLGVEAYFQPKFKAGAKSYHLCLIAMDNVGYKNLSMLLTEANDVQYFRTGLVDFALLRKYNEGLICTSACMAGFLSRMITENRLDLVDKAIERFVEIFGDRFYIEIMPYHVDGCDQEGLNETLLSMGKKHKVKCIATCDSHYTSKKEYDTYQMMHKIAGHTGTADYSERYMPTADEMYIRLSDAGFRPEKLMKNTQEIADRCNVVLDFPESIPQFDWGMPSKKMLKKLVVRGLKSTGRFTDEYIERARYELKVICDDLGFEDYFLLCYDIIKYAKDNNIPIGPGRGSVCGSLVANCIGITQVDPLVLGTDFERFLRPDKKKLPDIDMDFGQAERHLILEYIMKKHEGRAAQIATFGYYKCRNLGNDLVKAMDIDKDTSELFKKHLEAVVGEREDIEFEDLMKNKYLRSLELKYKGICKHFCRLFNQVRFIGKHAAGVAITVGPIGEQCALMKRGGILQTSYDLRNLTVINVLKMDILGLATASILHEACRTSKYKIDWQDVDDEAVFEAFREGKTEAVFQFEKRMAKEILRRTECDNIQDLIAANALNRPAPIQLGVLDVFVDAKLNHTVNNKQPWFKFTKETYGTIIFQEHVMRICKNIAKMEWADVDKVMKSLRQSSEDPSEDPLRKKFIKGCMLHSGFKRQTAEELYDRVTLYSFNKGHCAAYSLVSYKAMEMKLRKPIDFWCATLKFEGEERNRDAYKCCAVRDGCVLLLPHVNGSANYRIEKLEGDKVIREGLMSIKGVGEKAAEAIIANGPYIDFPDFEDKVPKRAVNSRVITVLREAGALEFRDEVLLKRVIAYNSELYRRRINIW